MKKEISGIEIIVLGMFFTGCSGEKCPHAFPPEIFAPMRGRVNISYDFRMRVVPDCHDIIQVDWGDGTQEEINTDPRKNIFSIHHTYSREESFRMKARGINKTTEWSTHTITIGERPFYDDFSAYPVDERPPFGEWEILNLGINYIKRKNQPDGTVGNVFEAGEGGRIFIYGDWTNHSLEVDVKGRAPRVYFRFLPIGDRGYYVSQEFLLGAEKLRVLKISGTATEVIAENVRLEKDDWWNIKIEVNGSSIKVFADGEKMIDTTDLNAPFLSGGIGIGASDHTENVYFDNVKVELIE